MQIQVDESVEKFITSLQTQTLGKTLRTIDLLEKFGNRLGMPHSKKVMGSIFELRVRGQQEVRIFYCFHRNTVHLLHGFIKKSEKTPGKELTLAQSKYKYLTSI